MTPVSIVTPWRDTPELIEDYLGCVKGAEVVAVDNGAEESADLKNMVSSLGGSYVRGNPGMGFARSNNLGLERAGGEFVVFVNSDVKGDWSWAAPGAGEGLYGPGVRCCRTLGADVIYLAGYCLGASRATWARLGGWDEARFDRHPYFEDVALGLRAQYIGVPLFQTSWKVFHKGSHTAARFPDRLDAGRNHGRCLEYFRELAESGFRPKNAVRRA